MLPDGVFENTRVPVYIAKSLLYANLPEVVATEARRAAMEYGHISRVEVFTSRDAEREWLKMDFHRCCGRTNLSPRTYNICWRDKQYRLEPRPVT